MPFFRRTRYPASFRTKLGRLLIGFLGLLSLPEGILAGEVSLTWDSVPDSRVARYEVHFGTASGVYESQVATATTATSVSGLTPGSTYYFAARACDSSGSTCSGFSNEIRATVSTGAEPTNLAAKRSVTASSIENSTLVAGNAVDGQADTRWSSLFSDPQWLQVDLGSVYSIGRVTLRWETAAAKSYQIDVSLDGVNFTTAYSTTTGGGGVDDIALDPVSARYVRMYGTQRLTPWGYSLWEFEVYGSSAALATAPQATSHPVPVAQLEASAQTGYAPVTVVFADRSSGTVSERRWHFGDGTGSAGSTAVKTYSVPGRYDVTLSVSGPDGADTAVRPEFIEVRAPASLDGKPSGHGAEDSDEGRARNSARIALELGEVLMDHRWQRISFRNPFADPIVVAKPPSGNGSDPAVVRVKGIDKDGFWMRLQELDNLDGWHTVETVSYMVVERGRHQMPDGAWVEAGRLTTSATTSAGIPNGFAVQRFSEPLYETPVVFATVTSANESSAVTTRLRKVSVTGFEVGMQEQERNIPKHLAESIDYIAWEPSFGEVNGMRYEVGVWGKGLTDARETLVYAGAYRQASLFLADLQTYSGWDTATLRWLNRNEVSLDLWVEEETSQDSDIGHVEESVGYFAAGAE